MEQIKICINDNINITTIKGVRIREILKQYLSNDEYLPYLAIKNDLFSSFNETINTDCSISIHRHFYESERRAYENTAILILAFVARKLFYKKKLIVKHSMCDGVYCEFQNETPIKLEEIEQIRTAFASVVHDNLSIIPLVWTLSDSIHYFTKQRQTDTVELLKHCSSSYVKIYDIQGTKFWSPSPLLPETGLLKVYDILPYEIGFVLRSPVEGNPNQLQPFYDQSRLWEIFCEAHDWGKILDLSNVSDLNRTIATGNISEIIKISEALHEKKIAAIADLIDKNKSRSRLVFVAGPSSSGKTTFMKRLYIQLRVLGYKVITISLDNYFKDRSEMAEEHGKNSNYETLDVLDLHLLNYHLKQLLTGKPVRLPVYDFIQGKKLPGQSEIRAGKDTIFIIEGIHGINPNLTKDIDDSYKFKIYISPLTHLNFDNTNRIPTHDTRLIRRIVRDAKYRGHSAAETIRMWKKVTEGEKKYIFTFQGKSDVMFNSSLVYEIGVLKLQAELALKKVQIHDKSYPEADRLLHFLTYFLPIDNEEVPQTSILREFIGKSSFVY